MEEFAMRITAQTLMMFSRLKLLFADLLVFSLTNPLSPPDTTTFVLKDLPISLSAFFEGKTTLCCLAKMFAGSHQWLSRIAAEESSIQAKGVVRKP